MNSIRVAVLCFVAAFFLAPQHALAQGGATNNLTAINARLAALEATVAAEKAARLAAEAALQNSVTAEANARASADTAETNARATADTAETNARTNADTALQVQIDKLKGNIVPGDLVGTYAVHFVATAMDGPPNLLTSYAVTGTVTVASGNTGVASLTAAGITWTEGTPAQNWVREEGGEVIECDFTWSYSNGTFSMESTNGFCDSSLSVVAGGQVMVSAEGGAPSNNQLINVWTRKLP